MFISVVTASQVIGWLLAVAGALVALSPVVFYKKFRLPVLFGIGVVLTSIGLWVLNTSEADRSGALIMGIMGVLLIVGGVIQVLFAPDEY